MDAWSLAIQPGDNVDSGLSTDRGKQWRNDKMGYLNVLRGEYVVRARVAEGEDPEPPRFIWEDPETPGLERLREILPPIILQSGSLLDRLRRLMTWVCTSWEYRNNEMAAQYAPWDVETIIAWGKAGLGHAGQVPIVMCVHYAVAFASFCAALGIPARCSVFAGSINGLIGHFTNEVWFEEFDKWVMVDPNMDAILFKDGIPLSVTEIQQSAPDLARLIHWGPGHEFQIQNPLIDRWIDLNYLTGICFRHRSLWPRVDFLSHPECSPAGHGSTAYCETSLVWEQKDKQAGLGMFPYFGDSGYFDLPPLANRDPVTSPVERAEGG